MGMFDSMYDPAGVEWQTKAYDCFLQAFHVGDEMPNSDGHFPPDYQVEVLGGRPAAPFTESLATIRDGKLATVPDERDEALPLFNYSGHRTPTHPVTDYPPTGKIQ